MLNIIKSWLSSHLLRLIGWGMAGLSVLTVLLGARQAGRNAERNDQLKKIIEVIQFSFLSGRKTSNAAIDPRYSTLH